MKYFANLREHRPAGRGEERVSWSPGLTPEEVFRGLFPALSGLRVAYAVNQVMVSGSAPLSAGDELALLPPLGGG